MSDSVDKHLLRAAGGRRGERLFSHLSSFNSSSYLPAASSENPPPKEKHPLHIVTSNYGALARTALRPRGLVARYCGRDTKASWGEMKREPEAAHG